MNSSSVLIISGGNRADSMNTKLAHALQSFAPEGMTLAYADIGSFPLFNQDDEGNMLPEIAAFKEMISKSDGIIFVTPEHNRSIPAVLKNALDWASRPYGTNAWKGKPALTMGATGGMVGTAPAQMHLHQILTYLDMHVLGQPEIYITGMNDKIGADGSIQDEKTKEILTNALAIFAAFIEKQK